MSKHTLEQLVLEMSGKSLTQGWDAVTLYDKRKANELLFQLYVERFNTEDGYIEPVTADMRWGDKDYKEHLYNLKLGAPWLSFEGSLPDQPARARLTMDMVGGMIVRTRKYTGGTTYVTQMLQVLPVGGPQLWMDQPVTKGFVTGIGNVVIDIKNAENFRADFVIGDLAQEAVGTRFEEYFKKELTDAQKFFSLGSLAGDLNGVLTPKSFEIRTMAANPTALRETENYGDGAVIMFITLQGGQDSISLPNKDALYLIPSDDAGVRYTGAMLLSSRVLFDKVMRDQAAKDIGNDISFLEYSPENGGGSDIAWGLRGASGGISHDFRHDYRVRSDDAAAEFYATLSCNFIEDAAGDALTIRAAGTQIEFSWEKEYTTEFYRVIRWDIGDEEDRGPLKFACSHYVYFDIVLDASSGVVSFVRNESSSRLNMAVTGFEHLFDLKWEGINMIPKIEEFFRPRVYEALKELTTPTLDTFLIRNLLFPGHNALQVTRAYVPGDLAVFGEIDPLRTTIALAPLRSTIEAGSSLQFRLTPEADSVEWSVRDVDGELLSPGNISSTGLYTAPLQDQLPDGYVTVIATAQGTLGGLPVKSSALVSVLHSAIAVNPMYDSCDPGETITLSAQTMNERESLEWSILTTQWGSRLDTVPGKPDQRTYTAGGSGDITVPFSLDKIQIKRTVGSNATYAYIHILILNAPIGTPMLMTEASDPSTGKVQFEIRGRNGPIDPSLVIWKLIAGSGTFDDKTGTYQEPPSPAPGSFIVVSATLERVHAVAAVPLPLSKYAELIKSVNNTLLAG